MEILKRLFVPAATAVTGAEPSGPWLVLTDSSTVQAWAVASGFEVVLVQGHAREQAQRQALVARLAVHVRATLVVAMNFDEAFGTQSFAQIDRYAQGAFALLADLMALPTQLTVIGLRRPEALVASVFDGLALAARHETTRLRYTPVAVEGALDARLTAALVQATNTDGVRYRVEHGALQREVVRSWEPNAAPSTVLKRQGCYAITGGAGGVGTLLAGWLVREYQANVCVLGRSPLTEVLTTRLKAAGVRVYAQADVTDAEALTAAMEQFRQRFGAVDGVFHLAGVTNDRLIVNKGAAELAHVLAPKVAGALNLWRLPAPLRPAFVCSFSSLTGLVGNIGQADYAAANAFVDALAEHAARAAAPGDPRWHSISWGLWASDGMQMADDASPLRPLDPARACAALPLLLGPQSTLAAVFEGEAAVLGELAPSAPSARPSIAPVTADAALQATAALASWIGTLVYRFTRLRDLSADASLIEAGVDSAALINLISAIETRLSATDSSIKLSKAVMFDHPSIRGLAEHLSGRHPRAVAAAFPVEPPPGTNAGLEVATQGWLYQLVRRFTGLVDVAADENLVQQGMDSVASINLSSEIERQLSGVGAPVRISRSLVFQYPSVGEIAGHLLQVHPKAVEAMLASAANAVQPAATTALHAAHGASAPVLPRVGLATPIEHAASPPKTPPHAPALHADDAPAPALSHEYRPDDVAIVGIAGEFPGADSLDELWALLDGGGDAITVIPPERWDWRHDYVADPKCTAASYGRHGGFVRRAKQFDPAFFGIVPVEAARIDPQERRLLEIAYHTLEDGGHFGAPCTDTGVFVAAMFGHYQNLDAPTGPIGASFASIANRISYTFDFQGPSLCVDTMCSGSLTALHLAVNSLRNGECREALVGAVNLMPHPGKFKLLSEGRFLSPTGRCHSFGVEADGYVPGEGAVAVLIKPLRKAVADGNRIHGVIRGSALNSGGRTSGFTVPSARAQEQVIRKALQQAQVDPSQVDYVEAHGTGTSLGDPIEINALEAGYGPHAGGRRWVGSIKSNIGHLESAAGLAGLAKLLLQFRHGRIAATRNCELVNPHLDLESSAFDLPRDGCDWRGTSPRLAGLSSFGAGGSNGHIIVQEYMAAPVELPTLPHYPIALSGRTPRALRERAQALARWIERHPEANLYAMGCTLAVYREHFRHRACFVVADRDELLRQLKDFDAAAPPTLPTAIGPAVRVAVEQYLAGAKPTLDTLYPQRTQLSLPHYVFEAQEYWDDSIAGARALPQSTPAPVEPTAGSVATELVVLQPEWRPAPMPQGSSAEPPACVVICDAQQASALRAWPQVATITLGERFVLEGNAAEVRAGVVEDCIAALDGLARVEGRTWLINLAPDAKPGSSAFQASLQLQFTLAKAMALTGGAYRMAHVHADGGEQGGGLLGDAATGVFRVLSLEEAELDVVAVRVDASAHVDTSTLVMLASDELAQAERGFSAYRRTGDGRRWVRALGEATLPATTLGRFRANGVYLITGGLGMIGAGIARRLMAAFGATVVLVGRSPTSPAIEQKLAQLRQAGGSVEYFSVDITQAAATQALIARILARHGALHGVIHSAGILKDGLLRTKTWDDFAQVFAVKADGARNLDEATGTLPLDFFVLFSSISSLFGNVGQTDYSAGNRFLDAFAAQRRRLVECGERSGVSLSLNWPLWIDEAPNGDDPMSDYRSLGRYLFASYGMATLSVASGADLLVDLLERVPADIAQLAPLMGERERLVRSICRDRFGDLPPGAEAAPPAVNPTAAAAVPSPMPAYSEDPMQIPRLIGALTVLVADLSGLRADDIDREGRFGDLGFSSVMLQQLAARIEDRFNLPLPPSALFSHNSIKRLATHLAASGVDAGPAPVKRVAEASAGTSPASQVAAAVSMQAFAVATAPPQGAGPAADMRIAIIGIDGRLPGGQDLDAFWRLLVGNRSAIGRVERWPHGEYYAGTIPEIDHFDARFFGMSAREAMLMDPQHRLFLQTCYNAMLDAGYSPRDLSQVGVFAGVQFSDYQTLLQLSSQNSHPYAATGNAHAMLANRVSYLFDFGGPSQTIDTACSSALVAVNRAVMALQRGECDYAIAGAVSLLIDSAMTEAAQSMGVLSPHHRCATFDAQADGYVRAEGVGCLLLKRYTDAVRDGDSIHGVIEASVENHGGRANSLTAPNPLAQQRLLQSAYTRELAAQVSYIETHGTGTKLGDSVEIDALKAAFGTLAPDVEAPVLLGSVKTNIGHLEPAAGIASMLKVILAFKHRLLPANLHYNQQNPYIDLKGSPFRILATNTPWDAPVRVAGISSFGFGGTNAHVVLSQPPPATATQAPPEGLDSTCLVVLSARSPRSLLKMNVALARYLQSPAAQSLTLADVAATLAKGREHFEYRLAWVVRDLAELGRALGKTQADDVVQVPRNAADVGDLVVDDWQAAREAYLRGGEPSWAQWSAMASGRRVHLPTYAFDTRSYWFEDLAQSTPAEAAAV